MQPKWLQKMEKGGGEDYWRQWSRHDQEAELMGRAASPRWMVKELAVGGKGRKRRRRKSAEGRGRSSQLLFYCWCEFRFVGRLSRCLLVEEKGLCGVLRGWRHGGERRKGGKNWLRTEEWLVFLQILDPIFFMLEPWNPHLFIGGGRR